MRIRRTALVTLLVVPLLLGACSDDRDPDPDTDTTTGSGTDGGPLEQLKRRNEEILAQPCTTEPTVTDGLTDPGQVLCLGTPAVLPVEDRGATGTMRLTVTGLEQGDDALIDADLDGFDWTSETEDLWFVRAEAQLLTEASPGALDDADPFGILWGLGRSGGSDGAKGLAADPDGCESVDFEDAAAAPFQTCVWAVMPEGEAPDYLAWMDLGDYDIGLNDGGGLYWKTA